MYKLSASLLLFLFIFSSCQKKTKLQEEFICETQFFSNTEVVSDFKNTFSITVPKKWKTELYFNDIQTQIFSADTTKNFTNTYTLNFERNSGDLQVNESFKTKMLDELHNEHLQLLKTKIDQFKEKPAIWFVSKGKKQKYDYYYFLLFVKENDSNYFKITSEIYGDKNLDERFCEAIGVIETLDIKSTIK